MTQHNSFDDIPKPASLPDAVHEAIAQVDAILQSANLATYTELLEGLEKLKRAASRPPPSRVSVAWLHEHITHLNPVHRFPRF